MDTDRVRRVALVVAVVALLGTAAIVAASVFTSDPVPYEGAEVFGVSDGPEVVLVAEDETDVNLEDMFAGDELDIQTSEGSIVVGGDPGVSAELDVTEIEGEQTVVTDISGGADWLELDPGDKQRLNVRGDVDAVQFGNVTVDDGQTDLEIVGTDGGAAEIRLYGLPENEPIALYDPNTGSVAHYDTTSGAGVLESSVTLDSPNQAFEVRTEDSFDAPTLGNPDPEGEVIEIPEELSIDVTTHAYPAEVTFSFEGDHVDTVDVDENETVSVPVDVEDLGGYEWSATVEDAIGQTETRTVQFETPKELTIREEHDHQTIVNSSTTTLRFYTADGEIAIQRQTSDGTIDMEGLPNAEFVVFIESEEHYDRRVFLNTIFEQSDLYVLNETEYPRGENKAIASRFVYTDLTGQYPRRDTTLQVQRAIDETGDGSSEWRTVAGDFWGAGGEFEVVLERGERYRLFVENQETGDTDVVGTHIPTEDLTQEIRTSGLTQEADAASGVYANAQLDAENSVIEVVYNDPADETDELDIEIVSQQGGEILFNETVDGPLGPYQGVVALNESQLEDDWIVEIHSNRHQSAVPVGSGSITLPVNVPGWLLTLLMAMTVTFVGALYGPRTALLGAWAMVFVASGVAMFGWAFGWPSILAATLIAIGATFYARVFP